MINTSLRRSIMVDEQVFNQMIAFCREFKDNINKVEVELTPAEISEKFVFSIMVFVVKSEPSLGSSAMFSPSFSSYLGLTALRVTALKVTACGTPLRTSLRLIADS